MSALKSVQFIKAMDGFYGVEFDGRQVGHVQRNDRDRHSRPMWIAHDDDCNEVGRDISHADAAGFLIPGYRTKEHP